jgi:hypothetical protein
LKNFYRLFFAILWRPFWKWRPLEIVQCRDSIRYIIIYPHIKLWWYRTMLNFCDIVVAILKMATGRNFSMSGINLGHHNLPTYEMSLKRTMLNLCVVRFQRPELIPDFEKFLPVSIFKMAATIPQKFNIFRYHHNLICG